MKKKLITLVGVLMALVALHTTPDYSILDYEIIDAYLMDGDLVCDYVLEGNLYEGVYFEDLPDFLLK